MARRSCEETRNLASQSPPTRVGFFIEETVNVGDQIELEIVPLQTAGTFAGVSLTIDLVFAGDPGTANCQGQSASALAQQYGSLNAAAAALKFSSVAALQNAIKAFCG
jgi:hypothetical protein